MVNAILGALMLGVAATPLLAQPPASPTPAQIRAAALEVMKSARFATFITLDRNGHPQARIVDPLIDSDLRSIWIGTNPLTRKVKEITRDSRVTLLFFNAAANEYVTVLGRATVVTNAATRAAHWKSDWAPFYKDGSRGSDFLLIEVKPFRLEVDSPGRGVANDTRTWRPVILNVP